MEIKRIAISESEWVIQLFDRYRIFYKQASDMDLARNFIRERLHNNESVIFVAFENGDNKLTPVGFTQLYPTYSSVRTIKNWILNDLYVEKEFRQKGIGEALIKTAMEFAKKNGAKFIELSTATDNFTAQKLYEAIGFKKKIPGTDFLDYRIDLG